MTVKGLIRLSGKSWLMGAIILIISKLVSKIKRETSKKVIVLLILDFDFIIFFPKLILNIIPIKTFLVFSTFS